MEEKGHFSCNIAFRGCFQRGERGRNGGNVGLRLSSPGGWESGMVGISFVNIHTDFYGCIRVYAVIPALVCPRRG